MRLTKIAKASGYFLLAAMLSLPAALAAPQQYDQAPTNNGQTRMRAPAMPGTVNYVEGQAELNGQALNGSSVGAEMLAGQTLTTQNGRAEILLTPGVILRVDHNSSVTANSIELGSLQFTVQQGRAMVEADQILKADHIAIATGGSNAVIEKHGLYEFNAANGEVRVWDGRMKVALNGKEKTVSGGHELAVAPNGSTKIAGFNKKHNEDAFYRWSSVRSAYLAEANVKSAGAYAYNGVGWYGAGWYWSPWFSA